MQILAYYVNNALNTKMQPSGIKLIEE